MRARLARLFARLECAISAHQWADEWALVHGHKEIRCVCCGETRRLS